MIQGYLRQVQNKEKKRKERERDSDRRARIAKEKSGHREGRYDVPNDPRID